MEPISSPQNPKVVAAGRLHRARHRQSEGKTLLEGPHVVADGVENGAQLERIFALAGDAAAASVAASTDVPVHLVTEPVLRKLAGTEHPTGPVAVAVVPAPEPFPQDWPVLVMVGIADPGNAGTLIRSAAAFGFAVSSVGGADLWSPKAVRSAAGAHYRTRICAQPPAIADIAQTTVATVSEGGRPTVGDKRPVVVYVGSEAHGLPTEIVAAADQQLTIPMSAGMESLNAAVAGSIAMFMVANADGTSWPRH